MYKTLWPNYYAMLNNAWSVWQSAWFGHDLGPLGGGQQRSIDIKSRCVTYVSAVTFNWLSKRSNCNHVSCNMTNITHVTDQRTTELFRKNVSAAVTETTRNLKKTREVRKLREDNFKYRLLKTESRRFWEYRDIAILDQNYRNTAWKICHYLNTVNPNVPPPCDYSPNLYITVTLGKWPGDRYIQGDRCTQVSFKLPRKSINSIFYVQIITQFTFLLIITSNSNAIITIKKAHKMSVVYF